jgi:hypothetical protein
MSRSISTFWFLSTYNGVSIFYSFANVRTISKSSKSTITMFKSCFVSRLNIVGERVFQSTYLDLKQVKNIALLDLLEYRTARSASLELFDVWGLLVFVMSVVKCIHLPTRLCL